MSPETPGRIQGLTPEAKPSKLDPVRFLRELPERLPGAAKVEKTVVPEGEIAAVLLYIRQVHPSTSEPLSERDMAEEGKPADENLRRVQMGIHQILNFLSRQGVTEVYGEGFDPDGSRDFLSRMREELAWFSGERDRQGKQVMELEKTLTQSPSADKAEELSKLRLFVAELDEEILKLKIRLRYALDQKEIVNRSYLGMREMVRLDKMKVRGVENKEIHGQSLDVLDEQERMLKELMEGGKRDLESLERFRKNMQELDKKFAELQEQREDFMLAEIIRNNSPVAPLVLGEAHELQANVEKWNQEHPNQKIALVVITPQGREG